MFELCSILYIGFHARESPSLDFVFENCNKKTWKKTRPSPTRATLDYVFFFSRFGNQAASPIFNLRFDKQEDNLIHQHIFSQSKMMRDITYATLVLAVVTHASGTSEERECVLDINRFIDQGSSYVWVCRCRNGTEPFNVVGRVVAGAAIGKEDTAGRNDATLRCVTKNKQEMTHACLRNPSEFRVKGERVLRRCAKASLNKDELKETGPFTFSKDNCRTLFAAATQPSPEAVWVCECIQKSKSSYGVVLRRAGFLTEFAPTSPTREVQLIRQCSKEFEEPLTDLCETNGGDFVIEALQSLETCCKRIRANFDEKFQCEDAVPDDLSPLKENE